MHTLLFVRGRHGHCLILLSIVRVTAHPKIIRGVVDPVILDGRQMGVFFVRRGGWVRIGRKHVGLCSFQKYEEVLDMSIL